MSFLFIFFHTDILFVRSDDPINADAFEKMSLYCDVEKDAIVALPNASSVYEVPLRMEESGIGNYVCSRLKISCKKPKRSFEIFSTLVVMKNASPLRSGNK